MKLVRISFQFQYADALERILDEAGVVAWARHPMIDGRDVEGKHDGSKAFPGNVTLVEATVQDGQVGRLLEALEAFRREKAAHRHLEAQVLAVERGLGPAFGG